MAYFLVLGTLGTLIQLGQNHYVFSPAVMLASVHRISHQQAVLGDAVMWYIFEHSGHRWLDFWTLWSTLKTENLSWATVIHNVLLFGQLGKEMWNSITSNV